MRYLMRDQYDSIDNLKAFGSKVALLVAADDEIIPEARSMALYESLPGGKKLWLFAGAGHNSWPAAPDEHWWREVMDFVVGQ
jgi:pimeloyl-ACP methyl ester carboxylesterase